MTKKSDIERWSDVVQQMNAADLPASTLPFHVLLGEAVDVAKFFEKYWKTEIDAQKRVSRLGLESAVPKDSKKGESSPRGGCCICSELSGTPRDSSCSSAEAFLRDLRAFVIFVLKSFMKGPG